MKNPITSIRQAWSRLMHNEALRRRLYVIIFQSDTPMGKAFDVALLWCIVFSILIVVVESTRGIPVLAKQIFTVLEYVFTFFFTLEYLLRLYCSPQPRRYAFSFFGIVDLLSTLPLYLGWIFLEEGDLLLRSIMLSSRKIMVFFLFMVIMVIAMGTLMFMVEGNVKGTPFTDIPTSIYWAVVTMTTVGYGDIAPVTPIGRFLSAIVMLMGYTILAVPTGIVSAQFVHDQGQAVPARRKCRECGSPLPRKAHFCPHCGVEVRDAD